MSLETYVIFLVTTAVVVFTPGAAAIAAASQGAGNGWLRAQAGVIGIASANAVYFLLSATGIASLIIASHILFQIVKWVGVAYLIWLGVTAILSPAGVFKLGAAGPRASLRGLFLRGFVVEFANPKALLYFAAIVPQFLDTDRPILGQTMVMGITVLVMDLISYSTYAGAGNLLTRDGLRPWILTFVNRLAGGALIFAGLRMTAVRAT